MNPYRIVHKGLRRQLALLVVDAGAAPAEDAGAVGTLAERWQALRTLLDAHHHHEDTYLGPLLSHAQASLFQEMELDHQQLHEHIVSLSVQADGLTSPWPTQRAARLERFYLELSDFTARYLLHWGNEEAVYLAALLEAFGPEELERVEHQILGSMAPELLAAFVEATLPALNDEDRRVLGKLPLPMAEVAHG